MPRKVKRKTDGSPIAWDWYAPVTVDGNQESREFEIEIAPMTVDEYSALERELLRITLSGDKKSEPAPSIVEETVRRRSRGVRGWISVDFKTGAEHEVTTGKEWVAAVGGAVEPDDKAILDDVYRAIRSASHLEKGLAKKSDRSHAQASSPTNTSSDGGAPAAAEKIGAPSPASQKLTAGV